MLPNSNEIHLKLTVSYKCILVRDSNSNGENEFSFNLNLASISINVICV